MTIKNRLLILLAQKETLENRRIPIAEVARDTGIDQRTLGKWARNSIARYDTPVIDKLCSYFHCSPGDLIIKEQ